MRKVLEVWSVPITQEDDGTYQFFGSGRKVYEYKTPYEEIIQGSSTHRLQTDFRISSITESGGGYIHLSWGVKLSPVPSPIGSL